jgi:AbiV family abortive infection protein
MSTSVTATYLLQGAAYALEQCGLLLRDANLLYRNGSYPSAVALALFAREELGRYRILLDLRKQVLGGDRLTTEEIQACCRHHERKQQAGMLSFVMRVTDSALGGLLGTYQSVKQGSEEWEAVREQLEQTTIPLERHKQRMAALYVDAVPTGWNRPMRYLR